MKKTRLLAFLLTACLATTCFLSGTVAKYSTTASNTDAARVARWGINAGATVMDLFDTSYNDSVVSSEAEKNVIAPGTTKTSNIQIINASASAPEVDYNLTVSVAGSSIDDAIKNNPNIQWKLDNGDWGTWDQLMTAILKLSGDTSVSYKAGTTESVTVKYEAGAIPTDFKNGDTHSISWQWVFETADDAGTSDKNEEVVQDKVDTDMGNALSDLADCKLVVTITAEQVD